MRIIEWRPRHAKLLAALWNASDAGWPGGLVHLRPKTAAEALDWERRTDSLGRFLAMEGRRPVGYARLFEWWGSPDATYVQWLNVDPRYQGRGVGKALLLAAMERTIARGFPRVDLHTWPGNEKAMRLYKRTGYMWVPGSHAYLQNYLPLLLTYEPARGFFSKHDWYASLRRDLKRDHDEDSLHGIDAFVYRFRAGRDRLEVVIDRGARGVMAFEDRAVRVEAWVPEGRIIEGCPAEVHWVVWNRGRGSIRVRIEPARQRGIRAERPRPFVLSPGRKREIVGTVQLARGFEDTPSEWASPAVESGIHLDGRIIRLRAGFRPRPAVAIEWEEASSVPAPGSKDLAIRLRNQSGRAIRGIVTLAARGVGIKPTRVRVRLGKGGVRRLFLHVQDSRPEAKSVPLRVRVAGRGVHAEKELTIVCLPPAGAVAYRQEKDACLHTGAMRLVSAGIGGRTSVEAAGGLEVLRGIHIAPGPPYWPSDTERHRWEGELDPAGPAIVRRFASRRRPGLQLEQRWRAASDRLLELQCAVENHGKETWTVGLTLEFEKALDHAVVTIPTRRGPAREAIMETEWPDVRQDVPLPRLLGESWIHVGNKSGGYGLVWRRRPSRLDLRLSPWATPEWFTPRLDVRPGERREFESMWLLVTRDWRDVRDVWSEAIGRKPGAEPETVRAGALGLEAGPGLVLASPGASAKAVLSNLRMRPAHGTVRLDSPPGVHAAPRQWSVRGLRLGNDCSRSFHVRAKGPQATSLAVVFDEMRSTHRFEVPMVVSDGPGQIRISGPRQQRAVANGLLTAIASATHGAALTSIRVLGHEYLISSYPKPGSFGWFRPFYGGVAPFAYAEDWPGSLYKERFRIAEGSRGTWRGHRLWTRTSMGDLPKGTDVDVEYLTRPGSPILVAALTLRNRGRTRIEGTAGFWAFLGLDGRPSFEVEFERLRPRHWKPVPWTGWSSADHGFAIFRAPKAPRSVAVSAASPAELEVFELRGAGAHGYVAEEFKLEPRKVKTILATLVIVPPANASAYKVLRGLTPVSFEATRSR